MAQVIVRNLENWVVTTLKRRAKHRGQSLEQELRQILTTAAKLSPAERGAVADRVRAMTKPGPHPLAEDLVREDRDKR